MQYLVACPIEILYVITAMRLDQIENHRTLYISRPLLNAAEVRDWAISQNLIGVINPEHMHVTVCSSKQPFNVTAVEPNFAPEIRVPHDTDRTVMRLGHDTAVVLGFFHDHFHDRWQSICDNGASWDYQLYHPHVTLSYGGTPHTIDVSKIQPFTGDLVFGPEEWKSYQDDWSATIS